MANIKANTLLIFAVKPKIKCLGISSQYLHNKTDNYTDEFAGPTLDASLDRMQFPRVYTDKQERELSTACKEMFLADKKEEADIMRKLSLIGRKYVKVSMANTWIILANTCTKVVARLILS